MPILPADLSIARPAVYVPYMVCDGMLDDRPTLVVPASGALGLAPFAPGPQQPYLCSLALVTSVLVVAWDHRGWLVVAVGYLAAACLLWY